MKIDVLNYIEVENLPHEWAIKLEECKQEMKPVKANFIFVHNHISNENCVFIDNTISDTKPEKIIEGITGGIADNYIEVGFWRVK